MTLKILPDAEKLFHDFLETHSHPLESPINHDSSKFHYFKCPNGGRTDARYKFFSDGIPSGYFKCWKCQIEANFCAKQEYEVSQVEWDAHIKRMAECKRQNELEVQKKYAEKAALAKAVFSMASEEEATDHDYLRLKQVKNYGLRVLTSEDENTKKAQCYRGTLLIRCYNMNNELVNLERIYFDKKENKFQKRPLSDAQRSATYYLIGEIADDYHGVIYLAEGYASAATTYECTLCPTIVSFNCGNIPHVAKILRQKYPKASLVIIADDDKWGSDPKLRGAGLKAAKIACEVKNTRYLLPDFNILGLTKEKLAELKPTDINDLFVLLMEKGLDRAAVLCRVRQQIQNSTQHGNNNMNDSAAQKEILNAEIKRLASYDKIEYELSRKEIANQFSIRESMLDQFVEEERKKSEEEKSETILFPKIEPWPEPVILPALLNEIVEILTKYVSFTSEHEPKAIALWIVHTYCMEAAYISPILFITSPEMRSGKSTLLAILQKMVCKCVAASSISPSVIYRVIPKHHPTLICDEADTYLTERNEDLRGIFNAGHSRDTSGVLRTNPDTLEVERFDAFGAKCVAAIKSLPGTVEDRSIIINMRRKTKGQKTAKLRLINEQLRKEFHDIQRKCTKFADDNNIEAIKKIDPIITDKLDDRAADNWYSLLQIAELAGQEWLQYANDAALALSGIEHEHKSLGLELLEDIKNIFDSKHKESIDIKTVDLIDALCQDDESPWATFNKKGKEPKINSRQLSKLLKPYGISSKNLTRGTERPKGYCRSDFYDAFSRYIPTEEPDFAATSATSAPHSNDGASTENEKNNSSINYRSSRYQDEAVAEKSGSERLKANTKNSSETPPHIAVAAVADKSNDLGGHDYIDV